MKKKLLFSIILSAILVLTFSLGVFASSKLTLIVNGTKANVEPILIDGVTYVPIRAAAELLGVNVKWDNKTQTATLTSKENSITNTTNNENNESTVTYKSCAEVKEAGKAPLKKGQPGYSTNLDRDGDGIACET